MLPNGMPLTRIFKNSHMKIVHSLAKSRLFILLLLFLPALSLIGLVVTDQLGANPVETLLLEIGEKAILLLVISLVSYSCWTCSAIFIFCRV